VSECVRACCSECDKQAIEYKVCAFVEKACVESAEVCWSVLHCVAVSVS